MRSVDLDPRPSWRGSLKEIERILWTNHEWHRAIWFTVYFEIVLRYPRSYTNRDPSDHP